MRLAWAMALLASGASAQDEQPLSAIDWLSQSVREAPAAARLRSEPPVAGRVVTPAIAVTPLDAPGPRAIGTRLPADSALPEALWTDTPLEEVSALLADTPARPLPALQDLVRHLMVTRAAAPLGTDPQEFALLRIDHLLRIGAIEDAKALIEAAGTTSPALFRRYFDATLLTGHEDHACAIMGTTPSVAPTFQARIFCLARAGDWAAAALTLGTARALGDLPAGDEALLSRFLDPDLYEDTPLPADPRPATPLIYRLREAIGAPLAPADLPWVFRVAQLRPEVGHKARLEAAEALAAAGVLAPSRLLSLYSTGRAAASGGVWERVRLVQRLERALEARDAEAIARALPQAQAALAAAQVEVPMASLWGARLLAVDLPPQAAALARQMVLLSPAAAQAEGDDLLARIAQARPMPEGEPQSGPDAHLLPGVAPHRVAAVREGLGTPVAPGDLAPGATGAALLRAVALCEAGRAGDPAVFGRGLVLLRQAGQGEVARKAALQYLLLDRQP